MAHIDTTQHLPHRSNLHTHSWYCGHGTGTLQQYVQRAKNLRLSLLGFSEHCPVPDGRWSRSRMRFNQIEPYIQECRQLQRQETELTILCGFECDHDPEHSAWYNQYLLDSGRADYLAFGVHYLETPDAKDTYIRNLSSQPKWLHTYTDRYIDALMSGNYLFGVHPDLFGMFYTSWDAEAISCSKSIIECAASQKIPLEINGYGCRKPQIRSDEGMRLQYPLRQFWELAAQYPVPIIVNSDAHDPADLNLDGVGAFELARDLHIELSGWTIKQDKGKLEISSITNTDNLS